MLDRLTDLALKLKPHLVMVSNQSPQTIVAWAANWQVRTKRGTRTTHRGRDPKATAGRKDFRADCGDRGGDRTRGSRIKRTPGDRPPLSARCFSLGIYEISLLIRPPVSTGFRSLVCQLVCHPELEWPAAITGRPGDALFGFSKEVDLDFKTFSLSFRWRSRRVKRAPVHVLTAREMESHVDSSRWIRVAR
jgi:hypothetical protein